MTEYKEEQEMEIEALESILADDFKEIHSSESGLNTSNRCFQITVTPQDDDLEESSSIPPGYYYSFKNKIPLLYHMLLLWFFSVLDLLICLAVQLGLVFSHTENYPDEAPLLDVKSIRGIHVGDLTILKEKLEQEATENLGMAMMYTLASSAKDWLSEHYGQDDGDDYAEEEAAKEDEVIVPHGEPVTLETFVAWRERYEAELALERAKLMPESALTAPKEKKLTGRQWFESGKARGTVVTADQESEDEDDEDIDFEDEDFEDDEEDMLEHYLAEKSDARA
ncbi:RWD domain-containing protein 1 isoform X1 [Brassica napus]|uniref:RWD domain-containing protein 1 isoform X1 n=1 Tax=Brassica napus TaxID=3708 RepID=UPI002078E8D4|nr:RWD domain-containing protein 1 isoform X1 [Brassica napus]